MKPIFGASTSFDEAQIVLIPVPWEVTASYGGGTSQAPEGIRESSFQMDFFQKEGQKLFNHLIHFHSDFSFEIENLNKQGLLLSQPIKANWVDNKKPSAHEQKSIDQVNQLCQQMVEKVYKKTCQVCLQGKIPAVVGGEHAVSEGIVKAIGEQYQGDYGLLHIDAHFDLRKSYQGFHHSHASVMNNILHQKFSPQKLTQVGIRDFCEEEYKFAQKDSRIACYYDEDLSHRLFQGEPWAQICQEIASTLPHQVYISLDVDGLSWEYSPGTGTPVPGGLSFNQALYLFKELKKQNKKIIGFDVVETSYGQKESLSFKEWNGNTSARLIYFLSGLALSE